jgi:hypothetical protein
MDQGERHALELQLDGLNALAYAAEAEAETLTACVGARMHIPQIKCTRVPTTRTSHTQHAHVHAQHA